MSAWTWGVICDNEHGAARELTLAEVQLHSAAPELADALEGLLCVVRGECPSLLNEDSGGSAALDIQIDAALRKAGRQP